MAATDIKDLHERAAVSTAQSLATGAGFIWRELTGRDIGIDAALELPSNDDEGIGAKGFIFLQVKTIRRLNKPNNPQKLTFKYEKRHKAYWLAQRTPVVLCLVIPTDVPGDKSVPGETFSFGKYIYWADYKSLDRSHAIKHGTGGCTIDIKKANKHKGEQLVFISSVRDSWMCVKKAKALNGWLGNVISRQAELTALSFVNASEGLLATGQAQDSIMLLDQIPVWEQLLLRPERCIDILLTQAKIRRRLGQPRAVFHRLNKLRNIVNTLQGPKKTRVERILTYENGLAHWTKACSNPNQTQHNHWVKALRCIGTPLFRSSNSFERSKDDFIRLGALVNVKAMLSCLPRKQRMSPSDHELNALYRALKFWKNSPQAKGGDPKHFGRLLNGFRALCRGYLARGNLNAAVKCLKKIEMELTEGPWKQEITALADLLLLQAWVASEKGDKSRAKVILECTGRLLRSMRDPLLEGFSRIVASRIR